MSKDEPLQNLEKESGFTEERASSADQSQCDLTRNRENGNQ